MDAESDSRFTTPKNTTLNAIDAVEIESVSVVVAACGEKTNDYIRHNVRSTCAANGRSQMLLVDPLAIQAEFPVPHLISAHETSLRPNPVVFRNMWDALAAAEHQTIIVVDPEFEIDAGQWTWLSGLRQGSKSDNPLPIQVVFKRFVAATGYKRILFVLYRAVLRLLLKTNKSIFNPGFVVLDQAQKQQLLDGMAADAGTRIPNEMAQRVGSTLDNITELLAFAQLNSIPIEEIETRSSAVASGCAINLNRLTRTCRHTVQFWWNRIMFSVPTNEFLFDGKPATIWRWAAVFALLLVTIALVFSNADYPLFEPDEARNAQLAMNVIESGDWLSLTLAGEPYWDKPPGQIWAIATSYQMFGISPRATRIPGAVATTMTIMLVLLLGQRLVGFRAAMMGALLLLLSCGFLLLGRYVTMDASLTACVFMMSLSLMFARRRRWIVLAGIAAGLGFVVKGPVVLVLGIPPVVVAYWLQGDLTRLAQKRNLLFFVPMLLIAGPWFLATAIVHPDFLTYFFWKHHVVRFSDAFNHSEPFWYYAPVVFLMMFPASYLLPSLIRFISSRQKDVRNLRSPAEGFLLLMALWVLGFFSISESKLPTYILPALPPMALLMGVMLDRRIFSATKIVSPNLGCRTDLQSVRGFFLERLPKRCSIGLVGFSALEVLVLTIFFHAVWPAPLWLMVIGLAALVGIALLPWRAAIKPQIAWSCFALSAFCFIAVSVTYLAPFIARERSIHAATEELKNKPEFASFPIVFFGREDYGFKMTMPAEKIVNFRDADLATMCRFLEQQPQAIIISSDTEMENLRKYLPRRIDLEESETTRHLYFSNRRGDPIDRSARIGDWKLMR